MLLKVTCTSKEKRHKSFSDILEPLIIREAAALVVGPRTKITFCFFPYQHFQHLFSQIILCDDLENK